MLALAKHTRASAALVAALGLGMLWVACAPKSKSSAPNGGGGSGGTPTVQGPKIYGYEVVKKTPHDTGAYTQGLLIEDGRMYESTGKEGRSSVRELDRETGDVLKKRDIAATLFGEGLAAVDGLLIQLTWKAHRALIFDRETLRPLSYEYSYTGEGWGLATHPDGLVMSDGSATLRFLDKKMNVERRLQVSDRGRPILNLNELEWVDGEVWANVWKSNLIARIDPETGVVVGWIDMKGILGDYRVANPLEDVLNGIALDAETGQIYVTGKHWPYVFEIRVKER